MSLGLLGLLGAVYFRFGSNLALAQAADSFSDVFTAAALLVSLRVAATPADEDHPIGHQRAEPIAALVAAVMAGVLGFEVLRGAATDLLSDHQPTMAYPLLAVFLIKIVAKVGIAGYAGHVNRVERSPALRALVVDARNDVAVGVLAVVGFFAARYGGAAWDSWLAIPVGLYVGWSGFELARENVRFLMGAAPDAARREELRTIAAAVDGVRSAHRLTARYHGAELDLLVHTVVDPTLSLREAHDIGHAVEARLMDEADVCHAVVHVDVEPEEDDVGERGQI